MQQNQFENEKSRKLRRLFFQSLTAFFLLFGASAVLYGLRPLLLPFALGTFLAYLCKPLVSFRGSKFKNYTRTGALILVLVAAFYYGRREIRTNWPTDKQKLVLRERLGTRCRERYASWMGLDHGGKGNLVYKLFGSELDPLVTKLTNMLTVASVSNAPSVGNVASSTGSTLTNIVNVLTIWLVFPLTFIFMLLDRGEIMHFFIRLAPNRYFELVHSVVENVDEALGKYIRGTLIECLLVGLTLSVGFLICGIEPQVAIFIGFIGGLTGAIPFVGTFIAFIIGAIYALVTPHVHSILPFINSNNLVFAVLSVVIITHILDNAIFQPMIVGHAVALHPLVVIIGVVGGSMIFGFAGLLFAIPTIVVVKVVVETFYSGLKDYRII